MKAADNSRNMMHFSRMELSGSLGDLGTILPLATAMIVINGLNPTSIFLCIGLFYILSGAYFQVTCPVEPMKVISAYAITAGISASQIQVSCLWIFVILAFLGLTGFIDIIGRLVKKSVIRGVQLSTGALLLVKGFDLVLGTSTVQRLLGAGEPFLTIQQVGFLPIGIVLGIGGAVIILFLLDSKTVPAALVAITAGLIFGIIFGTHDDWQQFSFGLHLPEVMPYGLPTLNDITFALLILAVPQIPMTVGNAIIASTDLSYQYFGEKSRRVTNKSLCLSMALANLCCFFVAGIPLCHGAGGLASRYRFGARTAGSNMIIGSVFLLTALFLGPQLMLIIQLIPLSVLGMLLVFAGVQLCLTIIDVNNRNDLFVVVVILGLTLTTNLAVAFITGILLAHLLKWLGRSV